MEINHPNGLYTSTLYMLFYNDIDEGQK